MPSIAQLAFGPNVSGAINRGLAGRRQVTQLQDADQQRTRQKNIDQLFSGGIPDDPAQRQTIQDKAFALGGADAGFQVRQVFQGLSEEQRQSELAEGRTIATFIAGTNDQSTWDRALAGLEQRGIDTSSLQGPFDPAKRDFTVNSVRELEDVIKSQQPAAPVTLGKDQILVSPDSGREIARGITTPTGPGTGDAFKNANTLRDEFNAQTKNFVAARTGFEKVQAAANDNTGAGDVALVFGFMKTVDPGSTVREGEFATAENTGSVDERVWRLYNGLRTGERLTPDQRQRFAATARSQFEAMIPGYENTVAEYTRIANTFGLDPANVIINQAIQQEALPVQPGAISQMTLDQLQGIDLGTLSDDDLIAAEARFNELTNAR